MHTKLRRCIIGLVIGGMVIIPSQGYEQNESSSASNRGLPQTSMPPPLPKADQEEILKLTQLADKAKQSLFNASADLAAYPTTTPFSFDIYCKLVNAQHQSKMEVLEIEYKKTVLLANKTNRKISEMAEVNRIYRNIIEPKIAAAIIRVKGESSKS